MGSNAGNWRALPVFLVLGFALSEYPFFVHAFGLAGSSGNPNPNPLGLLVAALVAASVDRGWRGPLALLASTVRVRVSPYLWLAAFAIPLTALAVALVVARLQGVGVALGPPVWSDLLDRFLIALLFVALGEEPAWRGFLQPVLQRRLPPLVASLCLAAIWAAWHFPLMGTEFAWNVVPAFLVSVVAAAVVLTWLYNASRSVFLPMLTHATINTAGAGYAFHAIAPERFVEFWWIYTAVWIAIALGLAVLTSGRLGVGSRDEA